MEEKFAFSKNQLIGGIIAIAVVAGGIGYGVHFISSISKPPVDNTVAIENSIDNNDSKAVTKAEKSVPAKKDENEVTVGIPFEGPSVAELTVNGTEFTESVIPSNPRSFYSYYKADEGKTYFVVNATLKNLRKEKEDMDKLVRAEVVYSDGYKYNCILAMDRRGDLETLYEYIDPLQAENVKFMVQLPAVAIDDNKPIKVIFDFGVKKYTYAVR